MVQFDSRDVIALAVSFTTVIFYVHLIGEKNREEPRNWKLEKLLVQQIKDVNLMAYYRQRKIRKAITCRVGNRTYDELHTVHG